MKTPSNKIVFVAIACIIVVTGIYYAHTTLEAQDRTQETNKQQITPEIIVASIKNSASVDTDKDGLLDWEEVLWKTDPLSPDTDKDGIKDDEDIKTQETAATKTGTNPTLQTPTEFTLTDTYAREAFMKYVEMKQSGVAITPDTAKQVASDILGKDPLAQNLQKFTGLHITHLVDDSEEHIHAYGNDVWDIMVRNTPQTTSRENEYVILLTAIQKEDPKELSRLDPIIAGYTNTIKELVAMNVPKSALKQHVEFINSMNAILGLIEDMRAYFSDSIRGLRALTQYQTQVLSLEQTFKALISYLEEKNGTYVEGESGYTLMHSI